MHQHAGKAHLRSFQASEHSPPATTSSRVAEELSGKHPRPPPPAGDALPAQGFTSGSPVLQLVWMRMVPMRTSLQTARSAGSMVSPARRIDTPVI